MPVSDVTMDKTFHLLVDGCVYYDFRFRSDVDGPDHLPAILLHRVLSIFAVERYPAFSSCNDQQKSMDSGSGFIDS